MSRDVARGPENTWAQGPEALAAQSQEGRMQPTHTPFRCPLYPERLNLPLHVNSSFEGVSHLCHYVKEKGH